MDACLRLRARAPRIPAALQTFPHTSTAIFSNEARKSAQLTIHMAFFLFQEEEKILKIRI